MKHGGWNMRLKSGDSAVPFSAETIEGKRISLDMFAGKLLLLMFYRYASCPMCNLRIRDFAQHYPGLHERGLEVSRRLLPFTGSQQPCQCREATHSFSSGRRPKLQSVSKLWHRDFMAPIRFIHVPAELLRGLDKRHAI
jgi:hypothetical protein